MKRILTKQSEIKPIKEAMYKDQKGIDPIVKKAMDLKGSVLDHDHNTQRVRKVLHRQVNAALGKIENAYKRYVKPFFPDVTLEQFLEGVIEYVDPKNQTDYFHPKWVDKAIAKFNYLKESEKDALLKSWGIDGYKKNSTSRKEEFRKVLMTAVYDYDYILEVIKKFKEN